MDRKIILLRAGKTQVQIADECGVDFTLVNHVVAGRRLTSTSARKVMEYIARLAGLQVDEVFPIDTTEPEVAA